MTENHAFAFRCSVALYLLRVDAGFFFSPTGKTEKDMGCDCMSIIPALGRMRLADLKLRISLVYTVKTRKKKTQKSMKREERVSEFTPKGGTVDPVSLYSTFKLSGHKTRTSTLDLLRYEPKLCICRSCRGWLPIVSEAIEPQYLKTEYPVPNTPGGAPILSSIWTVPLVQKGQHVSV